MTAPEETLPDGGAAVSLPIRENGSGAALTSSNALTGKQEHCRFFFPAEPREPAERLSPLR
jgi:hypothetical protein